MAWKKKSSHLIVVESCKIILSFDLSKAFLAPSSHPWAFTDKVNLYLNNPLLPNWFFVNDPGLNTAENAVRGATAEAVDDLTMEAVSSLSL